MTKTNQHREETGILLPAAALDRSLAGITLSRLLAETGLELSSARFVAIDDGRGLAFTLAGANASELAKTATAELSRQLATDILSLSAEEVTSLPDAAMPEDGAEQTLVLLKPDNFEYPSIRPGALLDHFARTGLTLAWMGVHHMSVAEAEEFYGPVLPQLQEIFAETHGSAAVKFLETEYDESLSAEDRAALQTTVGPTMGRLRWEQLIEFMTGSRPNKVAESDKSKPGSRKCLALIYHGEDAVARIRTILGPTNPDKAPAGTIRREFGRALMINAAHASDSVENANREMGILGISSSKS